MATDRITETVAGVVALANERGLKLDGHEGWYNVSKYAEHVVVPSKGARVVLGLDSAGFIRSVSPSELAEAPDEPPWPTDAPLAGRTASVLPKQPTREQEDAFLAALGGDTGDVEPGEPPDRETKIGRMAALNSATAMLSSGGQRAAPEAVLALAQQLTDWVERPS